jgi:hypothetical protein
VKIYRRSPICFHDVYKNIFTFKKLIKFTLQPDIMAHGEVEVYLYFFFNLGLRWGGLSTPHALAALFLGNDLLLIV